MTTIAVVSTVCTLIASICLALALWKALDLVRDLTYLRPAQPEVIPISTPMSDSYRPVDPETLEIIREAMTPPETITYPSAVVDPSDGVIPRIDVDWTPDQGVELAEVPDPMDGTVPRA